MSEEQAQAVKEQTYDERTVKLLEQYCNAVMEEIPELAGVMVAPVYRMQSADTVNAALFARPDENTMVLSMRAVTNLLEAAKSLHSNMIQYLSVLRTEVQQYEKQLSELAKQESEES